MRCPTLDAAASSTFPHREFKQLTLFMVHHKSLYKRCMWRYISGDISVMPCIRDGQGRERPVEPLDKKTGADCRRQLQEIAGLLT